MNAIRNALQGQLEQTIGRLKNRGGAVVFEDSPGALGDEGQGDTGGDAASIGEERELTFAVRGRLVERATRLAQALDRLRSGEYGTCRVCGGPIAAARLRAIPEATTCVVCQDGEKRRARIAPERMAAR